MIGHERHVGNARVFWMVLVLVMTSSAASAQPAPRPSSLTGPEHPTRDAQGWERSDGTPLDGVVAQGPGTRVTASTDVTIVRSGPALSGPFVVSAVFQRTAQSPSTAPYGLMLGSTTDRGCAMTFLVRPDGAASVRRGCDSRGVWTPIATLRPVATDGPAADRLEVRVSSTEATFFVNAQRVTSVAITPGELDGRAGVHVGAQGEVLVTTFTVGGAPALFRQ